MRLSWIDALKGFGIILVVFAHYKLPLALDTYIFSFHMPLFFFISGFLFNFIKYAESPAKFVKGRFVTLIIPYFAFALFTLIFYYILDEVYSPGVSSFKIFESDIFYIIYSILYAQTRMIAYNGPLWFLTCLFVTELLFYWIAKRYYWQQWKLVVSLIIAGIIGYLYPVYVPYTLPWNADVALTAIVFYGTGNLFRKFLYTGAVQIDRSSLFDQGSKFNKIPFLIGNILPVFFIIVSLLYFAYLTKFPADKVNMSVLKYGNIYSFYFLAFSGIFTYGYIFKKIGGVGLLEYYGRNSLIVLALHFPMKDILVKLFNIFIGIELDCFCCTTFAAFALTILNLLGLVPIIYFINRYLPFLAGKKQPPLGLNGLKFHFWRHKFNHE